MDVFKPAEPILTRLTEAGYDAYIVGGSVRDYLLNTPINDIDIATSAKPEQVMALFKQVIPVGIEHGTVIVRDHHTSFEVTTLREETTYSDRRHPDAVHFVTDVLKDLARRDFTMNAIALTQSGELIDPFGGQSDIINKQIQAVGDAEARFNEDPLRMLRAIRFSSQLGFTIEQKTKRALMAKMMLIRDVSIERIQVELDKFFQGPYLTEALTLTETKQLLLDLPFFNERIAIIDELTNVMTPFYSLIDVFVYMSYRHEDVMLTAIYKSYRLSNVQKREGLLLLAALERYQLKIPLSLIVYHLPSHLYERLSDLVEHLCLAPLSLAKLKKVNQALPIHSKQEIELTGNDLIQLFPERKRGKWIGEILDQLETNIITGIIPNQREHLKEWVTWSYPIEKK
ncbi:MAG: CCA tRNA nucleotidyltransferase [Bacillota bacterium]